MEAGNDSHVGLVRGAMRGGVSDAIVSPVDVDVVAAKMRA